MSRQPYTPVLPSRGEEPTLRRFHGATLASFVFLATFPASSVTGIQKLGSRQEVPSEAVSVEGLIRLDATVTDQAGKSVAGLQRADFKLLDNGQPQKIVAFRASKALSAGADDSLTIIILLDT